MNIVTDIDIRILLYHPFLSTSRQWEIKRRKLIIIVEYDKCAIEAAFNFHEWPEEGKSMLPSY